MYHCTRLSDYHIYLLLIRPEYGIHYLPTVVCTCPQRLRKRISVSLPYTYTHDLRTKDDHEPTSLSEFSCHIADPIPHPLAPDCYSRFAYLLIHESLSTARVAPDPIREWWVCWRESNAKVAVIATHSPSVATRALLGAASRASCP